MECSRDSFYASRTSTIRRDRGRRPRKPGGWRRDGAAGDQPAQAEPEEPRRARGGTGGGRARHCHGEFTVNGFRNRDIRALLFAKPAATQAQQQRQVAAVSRKLFLLRAHRLIRKVPRTHRYHLTEPGRIVVTALIAAPKANTQKLTKLAA